MRLLAVFCPPCARTVVSAASGPALPTAALVYGGAVARAIARMKYESRPDLARPLADLLWRALEPHAASLRGAVVVPVPLHPSRLAERGFNQSALLGRRLARHLGAPLAPALSRARETRGSKPRSTAPGGSAMSRPRSRYAASTAMRSSADERSFSLTT